jgi:hypothetical protein
VILTKLEFENWLTHRHLAIDIAPLTLIAGPNGSGKSSALDGLAWTLTSDLPRVNGKGAADRKALLSEGTDSGTVTATFGAERVTKDTTTGKLVRKGTIPLRDGAMTAFVPLVLDMRRFALLPADERRKVLLQVMGVSVSVSDIFTIMRARGLPVEQIQNLPTAQTVEQWYEAVGKKLTEARGAWRGVTGEAYGHLKAETWEAARPETVPTAEDIAAIEDAISRAGAELGEHHVMLGRIAEADARGQVDEATLKSAKNLGEIAQDRLTILQAELAPAIESLTKASADHALLLSRTEEGATLRCPDCGCLVALVNGTLEHVHVDDTVPTDAEIEAAAEFARASEVVVTTLQQEIATLEATVRDGNSAIEKLAKIAAGVEEGGISNLPRRENVQRQCSATQDEIVRLRSSIAGARAKVLQNTQADEKTKSATIWHRKAQGYFKIQEALAPDGIVGELLAKSLDGFTKTLDSLAKRFDWPQPIITADMAISVATRPYALLSESEQWRVDCLLTIALAQLTKLSIVALDRFDLLDLPSRTEALGALYELVVEDQGLDTCILAGTLKAPPAALPGMAVHWLGTPANVSPAQSLKVAA